VPLSVRMEERRDTGLESLPEPLCYQLKERKVVQRRL